MSTRRWPIVLLAFAVLAGIPLFDNTVLAGARGVGYTVCHQLPTHSFFSAGEQFSLCARCTGIYLGFLVGIGGMAILGKPGAALWPSRTLSTFLILAILTMVGDGFNSLTSSLPEAFQAYQPTNLVRLVTGSSAGVALALLMVPSVNDSLWAKRDMTESVSDFGELMGFVIIAALVATLVYSEHPMVLLPVTVLGSLGVLATLGSAGTALAATILRRERQARSFREALPTFAIGLGLSVASMAALGTARFYFGISAGL